MLIRGYIQVRFHLDFSLQDGAVACLNKRISAIPLTDNGVRRLPYVSRGSGVVFIMNLP